MDSILPQLVEGVEVVVSDNCSTDGTRTYLANLSNPRIRVLLREGDGGFAANVNNLVENSTGRYFLLLHDDDFLIPGAIKNVKGTVENSPDDTALIVGSYILQEEISHVKMQRSMLYQPQVLSSTEAVAFFSNSWSLRAPTIYYNRTYAKRPFYTNECGVVPDSKVLFDYLLSGQVVIVGSILGVYRQTIVTETHNTLGSEDWGRSSLLLVRYMVEQGRKRGIVRATTRMLVRTLYGGWLRGALARAYKERDWGLFIELGTAYFTAMAMGYPISWRFRLGLARRIVRVLSHHGGRVGRRLTLRLFGAVMSPDLVSGDAQLIGLSCIKIGLGTTIGQHATLIANQGATRGVLNIGRDAYVGKNVYISTGVEISIGDNAMIGANSQLLGAGHALVPHCPIRASEVISYGRIRIGRNAWIGNSAILIGECSVGDGSVVAAGAHVRNMAIPRYAVAAGVPARIVKQYDFHKAQWLSVIDNHVDSDEVRGLPVEQVCGLPVGSNLPKISPDTISYSSAGGYTY